MRRRSSDIAAIESDLAAFEQNEAYSRHLPFLSTVRLPRGVVDLAADLPPQDVPLLATTTALLAREGLWKLGKK